MIMCVAGKTVSELTTQLMLFVKLRLFWMSVIGSIIYCLIICISLWNGIIADETEEESNDESLTILFEITIHPNTYKCDTLPVHQCEWNE
jgi:hypothetical protein